MRKFCFLTGLYTRYDVIIYERQGISLAREGYDVTIVCCDMLPDEKVDGIQIISCGFQPRNRIGRMMKTKMHLFKKAIEVSADIYQISEPELIPLGNRLKRNGKTVVYNMRENYIAGIKNKPYLPRFMSNIISPILEQYMKKSLIKYDAIFSVTSDLVDIIKDKWGIKKSYLLNNFPWVNNTFSIS